MSRRWIAAAALAAAGPSAAQEASVDAELVEDCFAGAEVGDTTPDCIGRASGECQSRLGDTPPAITDCILAEAAAWDAILNREYRATRGALTGTGAAGIDTGQALLEAQRAWIAFRDAECALTYARWQDGSIRSIAAANCGLVFTVERTIALRDMREGG